MAEEQGITLTVALTGASGSVFARVLLETLDADRIGRRAAADRDVEPDERRVGRRLGDHDRAHHSPSSASSSESGSSGSAITIVRFAGWR